MSLPTNESVGVQAPSTDDNLRRDETFYFTDVIISVEGCLFRVHRQPLEREFGIFRTLFRLPIPRGTVPDGLSDQQPIRLDGIAEADFRHLLLLLFPIRITEQEFTVVEWTSVLKLSTMWDSETIRKLAISKLSNCDLEAADKLKLSMEYDVKEWFTSAILGLIRRDRPMGIEEVEKIGIDNVLKIANIRECIYEGDYGWELSRKSTIPVSARLARNAAFSEVWETDVYMTVWTKKKAFVTRY